MKLRRIPLSCRALASAALLGACAAEDESGFRLDIIHQVEFAPISEMSGIVRSPLDGSFWVHNDSGDEPRLFALDADGRVRIPQNLAGQYHGEAAEPGKTPWPGVRIENARNNDWEDVTSDGVNLYIADLGNNGNARRDLGIYIVPWDALADTGAASATRFVPVHYPEQNGFPPRQRHFDSESLFHADGRLYAITKHRESFPNQRMQPGANLYRLDSLSGMEPGLGPELGPGLEPGLEPAEESNALRLIDHHPELTAATAAELSPNGNTLAVLTYTAVWLFERPEAGDQWLSAPSRKLDLHTDTARQIEAIAWLDDETLVLSNEQRDWFELSTASFQ